MSDFVALLWPICGLIGVAIITFITPDKDVDTFIIIYLIWIFFAGPLGLAVAFGILISNAIEDEKKKP